MYKEIGKNGINMTKIFNKLAVVFDKLGIKRVNSDKVTKNLKISSGSVGSDVLSTLSDVKFSLPSLPLLPALPPSSQLLNFSGYSGYSFSDQLGINSSFTYGTLINPVITDASDASVNLANPTSSTNIFGGIDYNIDRQIMAARNILRDEIRGFRNEIERLESRLCIVEGEKEVVIVENKLLREEVEKLRERVRGNCCGISDLEVLED